MLSLVIGGSGSGKSAFAENLLQESSAKNRYYVATMQVYDSESEKRVQRHRLLRKDKGFVTVECPVDIEKAAEQIPSEPQESALLLECISNLAANEMFGEIFLPGQQAADKICAGIQKLYESCRDLVIVTNNVFEDGRDYGETTTEYIEAVGAVNIRLAQMADAVCEVTAGIPFFLLHDSGARRSTL